jgi:hypothetical protein
MNTVWPVSWQGAARERIERREGLVHEHDLGLERQCARDPDALLHAARKLGWTLALGAGEADQIDESLRVRRDIVARAPPPFRRHRIGDVAHDGAPRQQRVALEDHRAIDAGPVNHLAVDDHGALGGPVEPGQDVEHRGLAAARMADDADELAAPHRQPQILEHGGGAAACGPEASGDAFDRDEFVGHGVASIPAKAGHLGLTSARRVGACVCNDLRCLLDRPRSWAMTSEQGVKVFPIPLTQRRSRRR